MAGKITRFTLAVVGAITIATLFGSMVFAGSNGSGVTLMEKNGESDVLFDSNITNKPLRLTLDKSEILHLKRPAGSVIIGNSAHVGVLVEDANTLVIVPREPGASFLTIMDSNKNLIMQRHIIVASPRKHYVRIRQSCATAKRKDCKSIKTYYCPDMCHEIGDQKESKGGSKSDVKSDELFIPGMHEDSKTLEN